MCDKLIIKQDYLPYWITITKSIADEWTYLRKSITLCKKPKHVEVLFSSRGVCGVFVNKVFVESSASRHIGRVNRHDITDKMVQGENIIDIELGSSYFQKLGKEEYDRRGFWFQEVAIVFEIQFDNDEIIYIISDDSWKLSYDKKAKQNNLNENVNCWQDCNAIRRVSEEEYNKFWKTAALWSKTLDKDCNIADDTICSILSEKYIENLKKTNDEYAFPDYVLATSFSENTMCNYSEFLKEKESITINPQDGEIKPYVLFDFGRLVVGYLEISFENVEGGIMECEFDYSEDTMDFVPGTIYNAVVRKLAVEVPLEQGMDSWFNARRRAFRYLKISFSNIDKPIYIKKVQLKTSLYPSVNKGWFNCSDDILNEVWDIGRYTLLVNKHQEYESCPRHEMLFFAGDGRIDALADYYTYGDDALLMSSLSIVAPKGCMGIRDDLHTPTYLWDYPAWRIISVWENYWFRSDVSLIERFYSELVNGMEWQIARMDERNLIYQLPLEEEEIEPTLVFNALEYTGSKDRLGAKSFLNSLFLKSLVCMSDLAEVMQDKKNAIRWGELADSVKKAINEYLWNEEKQAYIDELYQYIPQDGNALAIIFGIANDDRAKSSLATLKEHLWSQFGSTMFDVAVQHTRGKVISPLMCTYEAEANFMNGMHSDALNLIRNCWGTMIKKGAKTFWEFTYNDGVTKFPIPAHAWSSGCTYLLPAYVLGVKPVKQGFSNMRIAPRLGDLKWAEGAVPIPQGIVGVKCIRINKENIYTFAIPEGVLSVIIDIPYADSLTINGFTVWDKGQKCSRSPYNIEKVFNQEMCLSITICESGVFELCAY